MKVNKKLFAVVCAAMMLATSSVSAFAAETAPVDIPGDIVINIDATTTVGDVINLGDGFTAVVMSANIKNAPVGNARIVDTFCDYFDLRLGLYQGSNYMCTVETKGEITYCRNDRWVEFNYVDLDCIESVLSTNVEIDRGTVTGDGTALATAKFQVKAGYQRRTVSIKANYSGNVYMS